MWWSTGGDVRDCDEETDDDEEEEGDDDDQDGCGEEETRDEEDDEEGGGDDCGELDDSEDFQEGETAARTNAGVAARRGDEDAVARIGIGQSYAEKWRVVTSPPNSNFLCKRNE